VLVLGLSPHRPVDEAHRDFLELVAGQIGAGLAQAQARQRERERLERLAELDRAKTEFFSNVSHEFRTPLTLMLGPLEEVLDDDALSPDVKEELELVRRNAAQLQRLVGTMLDFSQIEAGRLRAQFVAVDLAERTREIVALFESAATRAGLELRVDLQELPESVWVNVEMWEKIVSNLLSNALKFTFHGEIAVTLRALPKHAELVVRDTGVGIPEEELPHVFRRFHRVRDTRARTHEGAGIGLALVHELVRRHHGRIRAASTLGEGTTFTVWIPLGRRPAVPDAPATMPPATTAIASAMAQEALRWAETTETQSLADEDNAPRQSLRNYAPGARILVADDNKDMREYLSRLLASHWAVDTASDGIEALALARQQVPNLVVADVMMPGLDGFALLRELRDDPALSSTPIVLVTAQAGEEAAIEGLLAGAADYIVKPFSARELVARVGGQLELARTRRHAAELIAFRIGLSDALRALSDPLDIQRRACRMVVEQLGADRARFVEVDEAGGELITMGGYAVDGMPGGFGRYPLDDYAPLAHAILRGRRLAIDDTQSEPHVGEIRDRLAELEIGAQIVLPLVRGEVSTVALAVHQRTARRWTDEDAVIAEEAAGRAWAEVERARAEQALRASEERNEFLVRFSDAVRGIAEPQLVAETACRMVAEQLGVDRAHWAEVDWATREYVVEGAFHVATVSPISGRFPLDAWEPFTSRHVAGLTTVADDARADGQIPEAVRKRLAELGVGSRVGVPVVVDGMLRAALTVNHGSPRQWGSAEVALVEALAGRAWAEVERARAEAALRGSEERMRLAIGATCMVTWEWLPAPDRITTSDSLAAVYGLPALSGAEDGFALVLPEDRERHLEKVRRIAAEGGSYNSEFRIRRPDDGRIVWLEERAEAELSADGAVERVVGVTLDITERKSSEVALREKEARLAGLSEAFRAAVKGAPLEESLGVLVRTCVEQQGVDVRAAFYLADHDRLELRHIVGMPETYAECIDGFRIGAESLACGLATWTGRPVITPNVNEAPEWEPWRWLAAEHAYRGVWSFPIETTEGKVVGTLAVYLGSPRVATARDHELADVITRAAAIIISRAQEAEERQRAEQRSRETEARLADQERLLSMVNIPGVGVLTWEPASGTLIDANDVFLEMSGYTRRQVNSGQITWRALTPEEDVAESERQIEQLAHTGRIGPYEKDLIHADGSRSPMLLAGAGMSDRTVVEYCIDLRPPEPRRQRPS
jgi:PAS domain S-box-containing protein